MFVPREFGLDRFHYTNSSVSRDNLMQASCSGHMAEVTFINLLRQAICSGNTKDHEKEGTITNILRQPTFSIQMKDGTFTNLSELFGRMEILPPGTISVQPLCQATSGRGSPSDIQFIIIISPSFTVVFFGSILNFGGSEKDIERDNHFINKCKLF